MTAWLISAFGLLTAMAFAHRLRMIEAHLIEHIDRQATSLKGLIVSTQDAVNAITAQLVKAKGEITSRIADVQAQLDAAGVAEQIDFISLTAAGVAEQIDLSSLTAAAQALDDVVADVEAVAEPVVDEA